MSGTGTYGQGLSSARTAPSGALGGGVKRAFDVFGALTLIVLMAPLMLVIAALIVCSEGRPFFIRHRRVGHNGQEFSCFKFRTMVRNAEEMLAEFLKNDASAALTWNASRKLVNDPRITQLGNVLRKSSLDELPQLFNILRGEMSLVGPRPIVRDEAVNYGPKFEDYTRARPGLTGLWQVKGRSNTSYEQRVKLDCEYVASWSLRQDVAIILMTVPSVLTAKGSR